MAEIEGDNVMDKYMAGRVKRLKRTWDLLFVSNDGRVVHFSKVSTKVRFFVFLMVASFVSAMLTGYLFVKEKKALSALTAKYSDLEENHQDVSRERDSMAAKLALAEKSLKQPVEKNLIQDKDQKFQKLQDNQQSKADDSKEKQASSIPVSNSVMIDELSAKRSGGGVNIRLLLKSADSSQAQNKGYIIAALMPSADSPASTWKLSAGDMKNGFPDAPEKGLSYNFKSEKEITVRLKSNGGSQAVKVFVYDETKKVAAEKIVEITETKQSTSKKKSKRK